MKRIISMFCVIFLLCSFSYAQSVIYLTSGKTVEGEILERTDEYVKGVFYGIEIKYHMDEIQRIQLSDGTIIEPLAGFKDADSSEPALSETEASQYIHEPIEEESEFIDTEKSSLPKDFAYESDTGDEFFADDSFSFDATSEKIKYEQGLSQNDATKAVAPENASFDYSPHANGDVSPGDDQRDTESAPLATESGSATTVTMGEVPFDAEEFLSNAPSWVIPLLLILGLLSYIYFSLCMHLIANKLNNPYGWLAWIPLANLFLLCMLSQKPLWWVAFFLLAGIPVIGQLISVVISVILWMGIAEARDKPAWIGVLIIIPIVAIFVPGYLAFSD